MKQPGSGRKQTKKKKEKKRNKYEYFDHDNIDEVTDPNDDSQDSSSSQDDREMMKPSAPKDGTEVYLNQPVPIEEINLDLDLQEENLNLVA